MLFRRPVSDKALVERVLRGQRDEFGRLVERYLPMVHALAFAQVGNAADADDVAQDAFLKAYTSLDTLHNRAAFRPWLAAIARNAALSVIRARKSTTPVDPNTPASGDVQRDAEQRELHDVLRREILRLDPEFREVLLLHYFSELKIREVAETIGASPEATAKRIQRARDALGASLVRELGLVHGEQSADWGKGRTKIMAAIAATPVAWDAKALAGVGTITVAAKLLAGVASVVLIAGAAIFITAMSEQREPGASAATMVSEPGTVNAPSPQAEPPLSSQTAEADPPASEYPTIPWDGPGVIRGRVIHPDGTPEPKARVLLVQMDTKAGLGRVAISPRREAVPEADGGFAFDSLRVGSTSSGSVNYSLLAFIEGEYVACTKVALSQEFPGSFHWLELKPAGSISGRVVDADGNPVEGAIISPIRWDGVDRMDWFSRAIEVDRLSDADGSFSFPYMWPGTWEFVVNAAGFARAFTGALELGTRDVVVALSGGCVIAGTVLDSETGVPIAGGSLFMARHVDVEDGYGIVTGDDGTFKVANLIPGEYSIEVFGRYYMPDGAVSVALMEPGGRADVELKAVRGAVIEGAVHREAEGGAVSFPPVRLDSEVDHRRSVQCMADGTYRVEGLPPGAYELSLELGDNPRRPVVVAAGQDYQEDFVVPSGDVVIAGTVSDVSGKPVAGAHVELESYALSAVSAADGTFMFDNLYRAKRDTLLTVYKDGFAGTCDWIQTDQSKSDVRATLDLPACVAGRVVDEAGKPVAGVSISYQLLSGPLFRSRPAQTTEGGRFGIAHLVPGEYMLIVEQEGKPRKEAARVRVEPGETLDEVTLTLAAHADAGKRSGTVVDTDGNPIANAMVQVQGPGQAHTHVTTDKRGWYTIDGLSPGVYRMTAHRAKYAPTHAEGLVPGADVVDFVLMRSASVRGQVRDNATRKPIVRFAAAFVPDEFAEDIRKYRNQAVSMDSGAGEFVLKDIAPGSGTLAVWADGYEPSSVVLDIPEGGTVEGQEFALRPEPTGPNANDASPQMVSVEGVVLDSQRKPISGANVYLQEIPHPSDRDSRRAAVTDGLGRYSIASVPVSITRVFAMHSAYATGAVDVNLRFGIAAHADVTLAPSGNVLGRVEMNGKPVGGAWVNVDYSLLDERIYENGSTDAQGRFIIGKIPPGEAEAHLYLDMGSNTFRSYDRPVIVTGDGPAEVDFSLVGGPAVVKGTVTADGEPVWKTITITVPRADGTDDVSSVTTRDDGTFVITMLPESIITLHAKDEEGREKEVQVTPTASEIAYVEIDLAE